MILRDHYIRKIRTGWLVQPVRPEGKLSQIVETFAAAARIALPPMLMFTNVKIYIPDMPDDTVAHIALTPTGGVLNLPVLAGPATE